jgi:hypothetical protein
LNALNCLFDRIRPDRLDDDNAKTIFSEFCLLKRLGRKCRLLLSKGRNDAISKLTTCKTFFNILNVNFIGNKDFSTIISWWNLNCLPNRVRMFAFKFYNNILGINTRTFHFATNPVRHCQFCFMENIANPPDETFLHLFLNCPTVQAWHGEFVRRYLNDINLNPVESTKLWFLGITPGTDSPSFAVLSVILLFQYCIWEEKLRKRKPAFRTINLLFEEILSASFNKNKIFNKSSATLPYAIFRPFRVHYGPMQ